MEERWTISQIAERLDVEPATWRSYVARGQAPKPDGRYDLRTPWWYASTVRAWNSARPNASPRRV